MSSLFVCVLTFLIISFFVEYVYVLLSFEDEIKMYIKTRIPILKTS